jgi:hypothetical protein
MSETIRLEQYVRPVIIYLSKLNAKSGLAEAIQGELRSKWGRGCCCSLKTPLLNGLQLPGPWQIDLSRLTDGFQLHSYCLFNKRLENLIVNVQLNLQQTTKGSLPVQHSVALQDLQWRLQVF